MGKSRPTGEVEVEVEDIPTNQTVVSRNDTDTAKDTVIVTRSVA